MEGDTLTINKDTADKARDKHITENGITSELTDKEFFIKLNAEAHLDELAEISHRNKGKVVPDGKNHSFAQDGFTYRTVYFQDFDGAYYRITLSVGENGGVSTVYNVGKIKADDIPNGNIVSAIGSKADMSSANSRISQSNPAVKNNIPDSGEDYSIPATTNPEELLEAYENGEISRRDYLNALTKEKNLNPKEIADLTEEDANTTPKLKKQEGKSDGNMFLAFLPKNKESQTSHGLYMP